MRQSSRQAVRANVVLDPLGLNQIRPSPMPNSTHKVEFDNQKVRS
jgi:hypothetical protein